MLLRLLKDLFGGAAARSREEHRQQAEHLESERARAAERVLQDLGAQFALASAAFLAGDRTQALAHVERMRRVPEGIPVSDMLLSQIRFEGDFYFDVLKRIVETLKPRTYLEIGVFKGESLCLVKAPTLAIGVDPQPKLAVALEPNQRVFAETSDAFFAGHDVRAEFGGLPIDLAFIDGMHQFEYALRDFANLERLATAQSTILIHDCYPLDRVTAERERHRPFWSGDIWRLVVLLKKYRPGLAIHTIATAPTGLTVVRNLDPASRLLTQRHDDLVREFLALDYSYIEHDMPAELNLYPNDWAKISALLR